MRTGINEKLAEEQVAVMIAAAEIIEDLSKFRYLDPLTFGLLVNIKEALNKIDV